MTQFIYLYRYVFTFFSTAVFRHERKKGDEIESWMEEEEDKSSAGSNLAKLHDEREKKNCLQAKSCLLIATCKSINFNKKGEKMEKIKRGRKLTF